MFDGSEGLLAASGGLFREGNSQWDLDRGRRRNDNEGRGGGCFLWFRHDRNLTRVPGLRTSSLVGNTPWEESSTCSVVTAACSSTFQSLSGGDEDIAAPKPFAKGAMPDALRPIFESFLDREV
jgi:hypothetical protein